MAIVLSNLSGGVNYYDSPTDVPENQVVDTRNVTWSTSRVAVRRLGLLANASWNAAAPANVPSGIYIVDHMHRHLPVGNASSAELYFMTASGVTGFTAIVADGAYTVLTPVDAFNEGFSVRTASAHQKCFLTASTGQNRMYVQAGDNDPSTAPNTVRRTGLPQPSGITSVTDSGSGSYEGTRYFRYRYIYESGGTIWRRSEPSESTTFSPSASGEGATILIPTIPSGETITDWEIEASDDNGDFYRIATQDIADLDYVDTTNPATNYAVDGVLSEQIGDYELQWDACNVIVDDDRVLIAGSYSNDTELMSRVGWTPVYTEPGVGNDERIPVDPVSIVDLDAGNGGRITDMLGPVNGIIYVGKSSQIYKLIRTTNRQRAYFTQTISKVIGAMRGSMVEGVDETGAACIYFLDPLQGCFRVGQFGLQYVGTDVFPVWDTVDVNAGFVTSFFDPIMQQVSWGVCTTGHSVPNLRLVFNCEHGKSTETGDVRNGWGIYDTDMGRIRCSVMYAADINAISRSAALAPYHGFADASAQDTLMQGEIGSDDNGTPYEAYVQTRPILAGQTILQKTGATVGMLIGPPSSGATVNLQVSSNFGLWVVSKNASMTLVDREIIQSPSRVIRFFDSLSLADAIVLQYRIGDSGVSNKHWAVDRLDTHVRAEERLQ